MAERSHGLRGAMLTLAGLVALALAAFYPVNPMTNAAAGYARTVAAASAGTYVTLRTLNAFLSTAQEVEVGGALVVSGSAQPLKVLEPIDDTVERIAGVVFTLMILSGVLAVAMGPVGAVGFAMIGAALLLWALLPRGVLGRRLAAYGAFMALALPLSFLLSSIVADRMTADVWDQNNAVIDRITQGVNPPEAAQDAGWWDRMQSGLDGVERYKALAANVYDQADELVASYIAILAVFIFRIFLLPALLAGGFFVFARWAAQAQPRDLSG